MKYKLINQKTKEEHLCDKVTIDGFDYYASDELPKQNDAVITAVGNIHYIKDDPKDVGGIYWLKMIERGIVSDTGMGGLKHRNWTNEVPYEWELKRMKLDWRLLIEKTDDGVWHVMREYEEH